MKLYNYKTQNIKWKDKSNIVISQKNTKNNNFTANLNSDCSNNCFKAYPIKHYRKQYTSFHNNSYSRNSVIGSLDKPGNKIVTTKTVDDIDLLCTKDLNQIETIHIYKNLDTDPKPGDKFYDEDLNKIICTACNPPSLVIKRATTILDKNYSNSNKQLLYNRCKTFNQNLQQYTLNKKGNNYINTSNCNNGSCNNTIGFSNKKYRQDSPLSSSARITALKYRHLDKSNNCCDSIIPKTDYNIFGKTSDFNNCQQLPTKLNCKTQKPSNINILK